MDAYSDNPQAIGDYVWLTAEGSDRRSRGARIGALRQSYESEHGVLLKMLTFSYSETYGFQTQTRIRYKILRNA